MSSDMSQYTGGDLPSALANTQSHDVVGVCFSALFMRIHHLGDIVVANKRGVDEDEWIIAVENLAGQLGLEMRSLSSRPWSPAPSSHPPDSEQSVS
jgi:hypothetical protein